MDRSSLKILRIILMVAFGILFVCLALANNHGGLSFSAIIYFPIDTFVAYKMRCPNCGRWLGRHWLFVYHCPRCGEPLE